MRIRDVIIIGVAIVCSIICWSQDGSLSFKRGFKVSVRDDELAQSLMPKPIVVDVDGSGSRVLLASTQLGVLSRFRTHYARRRIDDAFVSLAPSGQLDFQSAIMAIGAGYTDPNSKVMLGAVITEDYQLIAINIDGESLTEKWKKQILPSTYWADTAHASISIVPERIWKDDVGTVAIAVDVVDTYRMQMTFYAAYDAASGAVRWSYFSDGGNEMDDAVREATLNASAVDLNIDVDQPLVAPPIGEGNRDETRDAVLQARARMQPWTTFREGLIAAMPHRYAHPWDAQLVPHVIYRVKAERNAQKRQQKNTKRVTLLYNDRVAHMGTDDHGTLGEQLNSWMLSVVSKARLSPPKSEARRRRPPNVLVFHGKNGIEVRHMYTGDTVTMVGPLRSDGTAYHDINDDLVLDSISTQIGPRTVIHSKHGVDLLYDCLGMIESGVPTSSAELFNATVCDTVGLFGNLDLIHHFVDGDVRGEEVSHTVNTLELLGSRNVASDATHATPPLVVQVQNVRGSGLYQVERYAVFMINTGLVTCIDPSRRRVLWRAQTGSRFTHSETEDMTRWDDRENREEFESKPFPHLVPYSLSQKNRETDVTFVGGGKEPYRRVDTYVLAVGDTEFSIIKTKNGKVTRTIALAEAPVAPVQVVDFNGDGTNDLIVVSKFAIYGFVGSSQSSSETVAALMLLLVGLLGLLFAIREKNIAEGEVEDYTLPVHTGDQMQRTKTFKRSTD
ncbi:hypothetical protein ABB37_01362 [Leptomonas pyrrhocoris]|uniref:FG-GAP repeat protein n=1 Tax=Leptomonas pyrrhocoris TaxID=157538 RepID=A0A0M9G8F5_LEPPY|nr:hypothetical protein ABB37_01362 [Leptomonas pyrrhocoris]KPA84910.1 hypothetical protein ABB37_01362 [Leptomonas pyrrhocoris]|eukprot:XP_015663349.1 hypothetical protein ABB37_01362 [Leptomonas pyrrhocoris]